MKILKDQQSGFTIIELLIASAVFSVILLIVTFGVVFFSQDYVKGNIQADTQDTARSILLTVAQDIEFNKNYTVNEYCSTGTGGACNNNGYYYCVGGHVYIFTLDQEVLPSGTTAPSNDYTDHALLQFDTTCPPPSVISDYTSALSSPTATPSGGVTGSGLELLDTDMRLGQFSIIQNTNGSFTISVTVAYGAANTIISNPAHCSTVPGCIFPNSPTTVYNYTCPAQSLGGRFCAVSTLTTTVYSLQ